MSETGTAVQPRLEAAQVCPWITLAARLILGGVLAVAGAMKVGNIPLSIQAVQAYKLHAIFTGSDAVPDAFWAFTKFAGTVLPFAEIAIGLLLVAGIFTRWAALAGSLLMVAFIFAIASVWARGISIDCGCFGNGGEKEGAVGEYPWEILRDVGLLVCGAWAVWRPKGKFSVDSRLRAAVTVIDEDG
ncbi:MAG: DoxX family protein [Propionibacteriaceae bacterium]|jgi:uncharacterized membrane protein YphA (DoxX/SURF4 family)|nr:DoxX family protein [Propionibacteriaceae bacterium]